MADDCWIDVPDDSPFPLGNLPLGIGRLDDRPVGAWVAVGDQALDLARLSTLGVFDRIELPAGCFASRD